MILVKDNAVYEVKGNLTFYKEPEKHIKLTSDKNELIANGIDKAIVTAKVFNYENVYQVSFDESISFEILGEKIEVFAKNGQAQIEIVAETTGAIKVTAGAGGIGEGVAYIETY